MASSRRDYCPHCGRPYAPDLFVSGPIRRRLVDILRVTPHGLPLRQLVELVYDDPSGGPLTAQRSLNVIAHRANDQLRKQGYQIRALWRGRGSVYRLEQIKGRNQEAAR